VATSEWAALREALAQTTSRFVDLVKGVRDPGVAAVGTWSIGEVVAHVREVTAVNSLFALELDPPEELRALHAKAQQATMDKVAELNELALNVWSERSPHLLAPAIREQVSTLLDGAAASSGDQQIAWLGRTRVPLKLILGHTLSELFVHGNDIARAMGRSFPLPRQQANLIFEMFLFELLRSPDVATFAAASTDSSSYSAVRRVTTQCSPAAAPISAAASMPLLSGSSTSKTTASGLSRRAIETASLASFASPITSNSPSNSSV